MMSCDQLTILYQRNILNIFILLNDSMQFIHREHVYVSSRRGAGKFWLEATHILM